MITGYVQDSSSGERLIGAHIYVLQDSSSHLSDQDGYFSFLQLGNNLPLKILVRYIGYQADTFSVVPDSLYFLHISPGVDLSPIHVTTSGIPQTGHEYQRLDAIGIQGIPSISGQTDVLNVFQLLPGVARGGEGTGGLYIRGGTPDQNLILLDGIPIYYAYHLGGFTSSFNPFSVHNTTLYHNYIPPKFGGRLSSVIDIQTVDGDNNNWHKYLTIGILSSSFAANGPIVKDKLMVSLSLRRSPYDLMISGFLKYFEKRNFTGGYYLMDGQIKLKYLFNDRNSITLNYYGSEDKTYLRLSEPTVKIEDDVDETFKYKADAISSWGNQVIGLTWRRTSDMWVYKTRLSFSSSFFNNGSGISLKSPRRSILELHQSLLSKITETEARYDLSTTLRNNYTLNLGVVSNLKKSRPFDQALLDISENSNIDTTYEVESFSSVELNMFGQLEKSLPKLNLDVKGGVALSLFSVLKARYFYLSPRFIAHYQSNRKWLISMSYQEMMQDLHLLSNSSNGFPADLWFPSTNEIRPQQSRQFWLGSTLFFEDFTLSTGLFCKSFSHLIQLLDGKGLFAIEELSQKLALGGIGRSRGFELQVKREQRKLNGWISYTMSRSERKFAKINRGRWFRSRYDRLHDVAVVINCQINKRVTFGTTFILQSGDPITFPQSKYKIISDDPTDRYQSYDRLSTIYDTESIHNFRTPLYHRWDIAFQFKKKTKKYTRTWKLGFYNVYNKMNPYYYYIDRDHDSGRPKLFSISIFPILPSFSFSKTW